MKAKESTIKSPGFRGFAFAVSVIETLMQVSRAQGMMMALFKADILFDYIELVGGDQDDIRFNHPGGRNN